MLRVHPALVLKVSTRQSPPRPTGTRPVQVGYEEECVCSYLVRYVSLYISTTAVCMNCFFFLFLHVCVSGDKVRGSRPVFEFVDPDVQVRRTIPKNEINAK